MGTEALSKIARRDIRRAYAPEASAEVLRFVENVQADLDRRLAAERNLGSIGDAALHARMDRHAEMHQHAPSTHTFWQRLHWLIRGTWEK